MSWQDWEDSFMAFKAFFDGGVTILRSIDELLPLCHRFNGFHVEFLLKLVKNLEHAVFGAQAIHSMQSSHDSDEVKAVADALSIKQQELENQRREMHALLLAKGISVDSAECVMEAASRLSPRASFVLFGRSP
ncbi:unnamed protein product [Prunus armeniaca]